MKKFVLAAIAFAGISVSAFAAGMVDEKLELGGGLGYSIPICGGFSSDYKGSVNLSVYAAYKINDMLSGGLEIGYDLGHDSKEFTWGTIVSPSGDTVVKNLQITPFVKASKNFNAGDIKAKAYGIFGLGMYYYKATYNSATSASLLSALSAHTSKPGFNLGGGLSVALVPSMPNLDFGLDVRWHHVFDGYQVLDFMTGGITTRAINIITPSLRVGYHF
jgi:opacity protein-like surface antigen